MSEYSTSFGDDVRREKTWNEDDLLSLMIAIATENVDHNLKFPRSWHSIGRPSGKDKI